MAKRIRCTECGREFYFTKYTICRDCRPKGKCAMCGIEISKGSKCSKHCNYNKFTCVYCGETFWSQEKEPRYCNLPKMCRYQDKTSNNEYVEVVDCKGQAYGDQNTYYILKCKICGQIHEARRLASSKTGFSPMCKCVYYRSYRYYENDGGLSKLCDRPRTENIERLKTMPNLPKDSSYSIRACMNCLNFETQDCNLTDVDLSSIEMDEHCCDKFKWYG